MTGDTQNDKKKVTVSSRVRKPICHPEGESPKDPSEVKARRFFAALRMTRGA